MSPTSCQTAPPRDRDCMRNHLTMQTKKPAFACCLRVRTIGTVYENAFHAGVSRTSTGSVSPSANFVRCYLRLDYLKPLAIQTTYAFGEMSQQPQLTTVGNELPLARIVASPFRRCSTQIVLKNSLRCAAGPAREKSTSQIAPQTAREHRLGVRGHLKTSLNACPQSFSTQSSGTGHPKRNGEVLLVGLNDIWISALARQRLDHLSLRPREIERAHSGQVWPPETAAKATRQIANKCAMSACSWPRRMLTMHSGNHRPGLLNKYLDNVVE